MLIDIDKIVQQKEFAEIIGISEPAVSDLVKREIISDGMTLREWILSYTLHLREQAAGRSVELMTQRAALARAQKERIEMQNAVTRGELTPTVLLEQVLAKAAAKIAGVLDAIPGMVRRRVPTITAVEVDLIAGEVAKVRNTVAAMSLADLAEEEEGEAAAPPASTFPDGMTEVDDRRFLEVTNGIL